MKNIGSLIFLIIIIYSIVQLSNAFSTSRYDLIRILDKRGIIENYKEDNKIKEYLNFDECSNKSIEISNLTNRKAECYEAYKDSKGQKIYYIQFLISN